MDAIALFPSSTRQRILDAAETLIVEEGSAGLSLRRVTQLAGANLAAVNYHFGTKRGLLHAVLARGLDPLHEDRLRFLDTCERRWPEAPLSPARLLAILFAPALRRARVHPGFLRFLGRVCTDGDDEIAAFLADRYESVAARFSAAFAAALPDLPPAELALRLQFVTSAAASLVASADELGRVAGLGTLTDGDLLARLTAVTAGALTAPSLWSGGDVDEILAIIGGDPP